MRLCSSSCCCAQGSFRRLGATMFCFVACCVLAGTAAAPLQADDRTVVRGPPSAGEARIAAALEAETGFEFLETPLSDVIEFLEDLHSIEIELDANVLEESGIGPETLVTRNLKGIRLASALNLVLRDLDMAWIVRDEVLLITTPEVANAWLEVRVYNVADLAVVGLAADDLAETIEASLDAKRGGKAQDKTARSVRALKTLLIVRDSDAGHRNVVNLLAVLRGELIPTTRKAASESRPTARRVDYSRPAPRKRRAVKEPGRSDVPVEKHPLGNDPAEKDPFDDEKDPFGDNPFRDAPPIEKPASRG